MKRHDARQAREGVAQLRPLATPEEQWQAEADYDARVAEIKAQRERGEISRSEEVELLMQAGKARREKWR
jgi:hypothetical protein